jgi:hypothetical protein|tara:strand:+ start:321 stop:614 length:294 start_codon:yes stop_codon:yes gene_type:complete
MLDINLADWIKIVFIGLGVIILASNFISIPKLESLFGNVVKTKERLSSDKNQSLEATTMWYVLKDKCEKCNLLEAAKKLDDVFPLLNTVTKEEDSNA